MLKIYPYVDTDFKQIIPGTLFDIPHFCKNYKDKCIQFYKKIIDKEGIYTCPYGFTSISSEGNIYTALKIHGHYDKSKIRLKCGDIFSPTLSLERFLGTLSVFKSDTKYSNEESRRAKALEAAIHEIRSLNADIKSRSEKINLAISQHSDEASSFKKILVNDVQDIFAQSSLITARLNFFDYEVNPNLIILQKQPIEVHKKFHKVTLCMLYLCRKKSIEIITKGTCTYKMPGYQVFDILPYILLENAYKYSLKGRNIEIDFFESDKTVNININSLGPYIEKNEIMRLFELSTRGANASKHTEIGTGTGLYFAKKICELHNIEISIASNPNIQRVENDIPFSQFTATLKINKH